MVEAYFPCCGDRFKFSWGAISSSNSFDLLVTRTDSPTGWGQQLQVRIVAEEVLECPVGQYPGPCASEVDHTTRQFALMQGLPAPLAPLTLLPARSGPAGLRALRLAAAALKPGLGRQTPNARLPAPPSRFNIPSHRLPTLSHGSFARAPAVGAHHTALQGKPGL